MKTIFSITTLAVVMLAFALNSTAMAQDAPKGNANKATTTQGPNFIDEDGDGICDNAGTGVGKQNRNGGKGTGTCTGTGTGTGDRKRLRDGSCGNTTPATGTTTPAAKGRRGGSLKK